MGFYGTHFVLSESMLRKALSIGLKFVLKFVFRAAKGYRSFIVIIKIV